MDLTCNTTFVSFRAAKFCVPCKILSVRKGRTTAITNKGVFRL